MTMLFIVSSNTAHWAYIVSGIWNVSVIVLPSFTESSVIVVAESMKNVPIVSTSVISIFPIETIIWACARFLGVIFTVILNLLTYPFAI